jgi:hypothetical protein
MWQRVILQAVRDALSVGNVRRKLEQLHRLEARSWMDGETNDFDHVCTLAGFEPSAVREWWALVKDDPHKFNEAGLLLRDAATRTRRGETNV